MRRGEDEYMENETRQSRQTKGMKPAVKVAIGVGLVLIAIGAGSLVGMMINKGNSVVQKEEKQSAISRVESEKSESKSTIRNSDDTTASSSTESVTSVQNMDGQYVYGDFLELPKQMKWNKTELGAGRDEKGERDLLINKARDEYDLGRFTEEYVTTQGPQQFIAYNIVADRGFITVIHSWGSNYKGDGAKHYWTLKNVYKYNS
jgi:flagellar basal body-associated protein FliL